MAQCVVSQTQSLISAASFSSEVKASAETTPNSFPGRVYNKYLQFAFSVPRWLSSLDLHVAGARLDISSLAKSYRRARMVSMRAMVVPIIEMSGKAHDHYSIQNEAARSSPQSLLCPPLPVSLVSHHNVRSSSNSPVLWFQRRWVCAAEYVQQWCIFLFHNPVSDSFIFYSSCGKPGLYLLCWTYHHGHITITTMMATRTRLTNASVSFQRTKDTQRWTRGFPDMMLELRKPQINAVYYYPNFLHIMHVQAI